MCLPKDTLLPVEFCAENFFIENNKATAHITYRIHKIEKETDIAFDFKTGYEPVEEKALKRVIADI